jgi:hypothetical protein
LQGGVWGKTGVSVPAKQTSGIFEASGTMPVDR